MPLNVLLPVVVLGILGIAVLLHVLGKSKPLMLQGEAQVREIWSAQYPNSTVKQVLIAANKTRAILDTATGPGLVWSMGIRAACRELPPGCVVSNSPRGLNVRIGDYTAPRVSIRLDDQAEAARWLGILKGNIT